MITELFFAYRANLRDLFLFKCELFGLIYMAYAADHTLDPPFFAWLVLVMPKLFAAYSAINNLFFSKEVQVKILDTLAHTKMYISCLFMRGHCLPSAICN
jgi:hypothetical protein